MNNDGLHERGKALEDNFFRERDRELLKRLREGTDSESKRSALTSACGIQDEKVLDELLERGISVENLVAISMVPLIMVAWADDIMEEAEIAAVLKAARGTGIEEGSGAHTMVESWLKEKPDDRLLDTWKDYIGGLRSILADGAFSQLKSSVMDRAHDVAASAGGFLGMGNKISAVEREVLDDLESVFSG